MIIKNMIKCNICGDIIESKHRHDFVTCNCGACAVDGGRDYLKRCGDRNNWEELSITKKVTCGQCEHYIGFDASNGYVEGKSNCRARSSAFEPYPIVKNPDSNACTLFEPLEGESIDD